MKAKRGDVVSRSAKGGMHIGSDVRCLVVLCSKELGMGNGVQVLRFKTCLGCIEASWENWLLVLGDYLRSLLCAVHGGESV